MTDDFVEYPNLPLVLENPEAELSLPVPVGKWVCVQYPMAKKTTKSGIHLPDQTVDMDAYLMSNAKVVAIGPMAFNKADGTRTSVPREHLFCVGDLVRVPQYGNSNDYLGTGPDPVHIGYFDPTQIMAIVKPIRERPTWNEYERDYTFGRRTK